MPLHSSTRSLAFLFLLLILPCLVASKAKAPRADTAPQPVASRRMGKRKEGQHVLKAPQKKDYSAFLCPNGAAACPVPVKGTTRSAVQDADLVTLADWFKAGFECIDTASTLTSCGGCRSLNTGQDCTSIPNTLDVACQAGTCTILACKEGHSQQGKSCIKRANLAAGGGSTGGKMGKKGFPLR